MKLALLPFLAAVLSAQTFPETSPLEGTSASQATLVYNANGIQVGPDGKLQRFTGLLVEGGRVKQVYRTGDRVPAYVKNALDAQGRTVLPGLVDAHGHVIDAPGGDVGMGLLLLQLDVSGTRSVEELSDRLAAYAESNPGSSWILGRGWNQELWPDKRLPTAADLDAVVADRPVLLARTDGHAAVANSAALKVAGVTAATPDPSGGKIERLENGEPNGLLIENAVHLVASHAPARTPEQMTHAMEVAQAQLLSNGITTVADMGTSPNGWEAMRRFGETSRLKVRIIAYSDAFGPLPAGIDAPTDWLYGDRLRMSGLKLFSDGSLGSRSARLKQPYADAQQTSGLAVTPPEELRRQAAEAAAKGFQVAIHAIGDRANAEVISIFEDLGRTHGRDLRWRIEHAQVIDPLDIPRLAPAGIIASMQPIHQVSDRLMAEARLGPDRLAGAYAWQTIARSGARLAFGSDFPVEPPNPFLGLSAAVSRQDPKGIPPGGWIPSERLSFEQALAGFTLGAAHAGFAEDRIGSLEPGKWADFIIIDRDPTQVDAQSLARTQVLETWVAGKKVWERAASPGAAGERGK